MELHEKYIEEISPLPTGDSLYIANRVNRQEFTFPLHSHAEFELTYIKGASQARRIVGDSVEVIGEYDLVLITGECLKHKFEQYNCTSSRFHEIVIQFSPHLISPDSLRKPQMRSIGDMFERGRKGLAFPESAIREVESRLVVLSGDEKRDFHSVISFMDILYRLSLCTDARQLSSLETLHTAEYGEQELHEYVSRNLLRNITPEEVARVMAIPEAVFEETFRLKTGKSLTRYVSDVRISQAVKLLYSATMSVSEICYSVGFDSLPVFDRMFKKSMGCTPKEYRRNKKTAK